MKKPLIPWSSSSIPRRSSSSHMSSLLRNPQINNSFAASGLLYWIALKDISHVANTDLSCFPPFHPLLSK